MARAISFLVLASVGALLFACFRHYNASYAPRLRPGEGWIHLQPRFYDEAFGEFAGVFRDHVQCSWMPGPEASVLTKTDPPFTRSTVKAFREEFGRMVKENFPGSSITDCRTVKTDEAVWYRHTWEPNMLVLWDNRVVLHRATGGYEGHERLLHRTTIGYNPDVREGV